MRWEKWRYPHQTQESLKNWHQKQPNLFKKCAYNLAVLDKQLIP